MDAFFSQYGQAIICSAIPFAIILFIAISASRQEPDYLNRWYKNHSGWFWIQTVFLIYSFLYWGFDYFLLFLPFYFGWRILEFFSN